MLMIPFLAHVLRCPTCRGFPRTPCVTGYELFHRGADRELRRYDPRRAKA